MKTTSTIDWDEICAMASGKKPVEGKEKDGYQMKDGSYGDKYGPTAMKKDYGNKNDTKLVPEHHKKGHHGQNMTEHKSVFADGKMPSTKGTFRKFFN